MKKTIGLILIIGLSASFLPACSNTGVGTVAGGAAGAGIGYAVSGGNAVGTLVGAGTGAVIGNTVGQEEDMANYYGPRYGF